jgi:predicted RNA binding protein YcfA (HicA-like mRNA interferase family)
MTMDAGPFPNMDDAKRQSKGNSHEQAGAVPEAMSLAAFLAAAKPPEFLIDPILQRGFLYSLTALTFHGKTSTMIYMSLCVAAPKSFAGHDTQQGNVVYFAGENPDDIAQKFLVACDFWGLDATKLPITIIPGAFDLAGNLDTALAKASAHDPTLVAIDTSAAYRFDADEDDNQGSKQWGQNLRQFTHLTSKPAVVVPTHPTKHADRSNLLPRGGSGLLNELDGNLSLWADLNAGTTELHWCGKLRGPSFPPIALDLRKHPHPTWCHRDGSPVEMVAVAPSPLVTGLRASNKAVVPTPNETIGQRTLERALKDHGIMATVFDNHVEGLVVRVDAWRDRFYSEGKPAEDRKTKEKAFKRVVDGLLAKELIGTRDGLVWPARPTR